jgi:hypothetical protein
MLAVAVAVQGLTERLVLAVLVAGAQALILEQCRQLVPQLTQAAVVVVLVLLKVLQTAQAATAALAL